MDVEAILRDHIGGLVLSNSILLARALAAEAKVSELQKQLTDQEKA